MEEIIEMRQRDKEWFYEKCRKATQKKIRPISYTARRVRLKKYRAAKNREANP